MVGAQHHPHGVRNDHAHEADHATHRHHRPGQERRREEHGFFDPFRIDPQGSCGFVSQGQQVEGAGLAEQDQSARHQIQGEDGQQGVARCG